MDEYQKPSKLSVVSLGLGVLGVFTFWMLPFWIGAAAVVTGFFALRDVKTKGVPGAQQAKAGIISGFINIALSIALAIFIYVTFYAK